jgi:protein TonB
MKICHTCQQSYSDDIEFCPRDSARLPAQVTETEAQPAAGLSRRFRIVRRLGAGEKGNSQIKAVGLIGLVVVIMAILAWRFWPGSVRPGSREGTTAPEQKAPTTQAGIQASVSTVNNPPGKGNPTLAHAPTEHSRSANPAAAQQGGGVAGSVPFPVAGNRMPQVAGSAPSVALPPLPTLKPHAPKRIRVSSRDQAARLILPLQTPEYPPFYRGPRIPGVVRLDAVISKDGKVQTLKAISGNPVLVKVAMDAAKNWRYQPTLLNGEAVEVATEIDINFTVAD